MKAKVLIVFGLLCLLVLSIAVATGFIFSVMQPTSSTPRVFVDPVAIVDDTAQAGSVVSVDVNVSNVIDLYAWQINITWDASILNVHDIVAGEFLLRTASPDETAAFQLGHVINVTDNAEGYTCMSEAILGDVGGISDNGTLVSIEFLVVGYGSTDLTIGVSGDLPTTLLDSAMGAVIYDTTDGFFSNFIPGDMQGDTPGSPRDGDVDWYDFGAFADAYGSLVGEPNWNSLADLQGDTPGSPPDGDVDWYDFGAFADNYGEAI